MIPRLPHPTPPPKALRSHEQPLQSISETTRKCCINTGAGEDFKSRGRRDRTESGSQAHWVPPFDQNPGKDRPSSEVPAVPSSGAAGIPGDC